jgi:hypothetical protein
MKLLLNLIDQVLARCSRTEAAHILMNMLETGIDKLGVLYRIYEDLMRMTDGPKPSESDELSIFSSVERLKPVETIAYLVENPEVVLRGSSFTHLSPCFAPLVVTNLTHDVYRSYATASGAPQDPE